MEPIRLRPVTERAIGTTAFFRNRALLQVLCQRMANLSGSVVRVLVHACSIGAEVYSLLIAARLHSALSRKHVLVSATDLEASFIKFAAAGTYPLEVLAGMTDDERRFFRPVDSAHVQVSPDIRQSATYLPPASFVTFESGESFDVVCLLNALIYVEGSQQSQAIDRIASYNRSVLVTTGFHADRIKDDLTRNGYRPVLDQLRAIHDGWRDRRKPAVDRNEVVPGHIFYPWSLPPFSEIPDYEFKYGALFERAS